MSKKRVTLRDVATMAEVSVATASYALSGNPIVKESTSARVLDAARHLNYVRPGTANYLGKVPTKCIAVAFTGRQPAMHGSAFYAFVVQGITSVLESEGYAMRLVQLDDSTSPDTARHGHLPFSEESVDGGIILNYQDPVMMYRLQELGIPLVAVDTSGAHPGIPSIDNDDRASARIGTAHLLELGHRRIALLGGSLAKPFDREIFLGYLEAHQAYRVAIDPSLLDFNVEEATGVAAGQLAMSRLLASDPRPTALFASDDERAVGAMHAAIEAGLRVPGDISVVGMGDLPLAESIRPGLTSVLVEREALGRHAARTLLETAKGAYSDPATLIVEPKLIVRDSTAPASST